VKITPRQQLYWLGGLLVVLVAIVSWRFRGDSPEASAATPQAGTTATPSNQTGRGGRQNMPVTDVKLDALRHDGAELPEAERNPFRFQQKALPPPPPRPAVQAAPQVYVPPAPAGPPPPPPIPLHYVGYYNKTSTDRIAVLSDARGTPVYGREGEIVDGRYRLLRVSADSVDIAYADGRGRQTLRMTAPTQ
jgi:hypothetical protein